MIEHIQVIYYLSTYLINLLFFCFLYIPLFNTCNVKKRIKKNGKVKIVSKPKIILAFTYLLLLYILFKCFTFKMIIFIIILLTIGSLFMVDKFTPKLDEYLHTFNKLGPIIICWKLLHTIFTLINIITEPMFSSINNYANKKISMCKNIITQIANLNSDDTDKNFRENIESKINEEISNMSDYVFKSNKSTCKKKILKEEEKNDENNENNENNQNDENNDNLECSKREMEKKMEEITNLSLDDDMALTFTEVKN